MLASSFVSARRSPVAALVVAAAALVAAPAAAEDGPKRKSGLWEMKMTSESMPGQAFTMHACVDKATDDLTEVDESMTECPKPTVRRDGASWVIDLVCTIEGSKMTAHTVMTGNFESAFRASSDATYEPPLQGMANVSSLIEGRWLGPCKPGQKPGDVEMPELDALMKGVEDAAPKK